MWSQGQSGFATLLFSLKMRMNGDTVAEFGERVCTILHHSGALVHEAMNTDEH